MSCCYYTIYIYHILKYKYHRLKENIRNKCCFPKPEPDYQLEEVIVINNEDSLETIQPNKNYAFKYINESSSEEVIYDRDEEPNTSSSKVPNITITDSDATYLFTNENKLRRRNALNRKISKGKLIKKRRNKKYKKYKKFENNIEDLINPNVESPTTRELNGETVEYETITDIHEEDIVLENKIKKYTKKKEKKIEVISSEEEGEPIYEEIKEDFISEEKLIKEKEIIPKEKIIESAEIILDKETLLEDISVENELSSGLEDWDIIKN